MAKTPPSHFEIGTPEETSARRLSPEPLVSPARSPAGRLASFARAELEHAGLSAGGLVGRLLKGSGHDPDERSVVGVTAVPLVEREGDPEGARETLEVLDFGPPQTGCV